MPVPTPLLLMHGWGSLTWGLGHTAQLSAPMQVRGGFREGDKRLGAALGPGWAASLLCTGFVPLWGCNPVVGPLAFLYLPHVPSYGVGLRALSCEVWGLSCCVLSAAGRN